VRARLIKTALAALVALPLAAATGCGSSSDGTSQTQPALAPSDGAFPTNGTTTGADVITTPGTAAKKESGQAGGGSSATCIGC
jgi:hypothetical protein